MTAVNRICQMPDMCRCYMPPDVSVCTHIAHVCSYNTCRHILCTLRHGSAIHCVVVYSNDHKGVIKVVRRCGQGGRLFYWNRMHPSSVLLYPCFLVAESNEILVGEKENKIMFHDCIRRSRNV